MPRPRCQIELVFLTWASPSKSATTKVVTRWMWDREPAWNSHTWWWAHLFSACPWALTCSSLDHQCLAFSFLAIFGLEERHTVRHATCSVVFSGLVPARRSQHMEHGVCGCRSSRAEYCFKLWYRIPSEQRLGESFFPSTSRRGLTSEFCPCAILINFANVSKIRWLLQKSWRRCTAWPLHRVTTWHETCG